MEAERLLEYGRRRVAVEGVSPEIDAGRFPAKRAVGDAVVVEADAFTDGHDQLACSLYFRGPDDAGWQEMAMQALPNDRWRGAFTVTRLGVYRFRIAAWVDPFLTWRRDLGKRIQAGQDLKVPYLTAAELIEAAAARAQAGGPDAAAGGPNVAANAAEVVNAGPNGVGPSDAELLRQAAAFFRSDAPWEAKRERAEDPQLARLMRSLPHPEFVTHYGRELEVRVDPPRARFSTWYELFPRSCGVTAAEPGAHGGFKDCITRLPAIAAMGFDVLYLPPIHPIGRVARKGRNNAEQAQPGDVGSPWAIGAEEGGHKAIHPQLGTLADFDALVAGARGHGIELALDIAFQVAPDHPYVKEHPEWFKRRPDGTVQYAENPPKKYQDIYPFDFEGEAWAPLWEELKSVVEFWAGRGVTVFRVDNPHTKPFRMWEWLIGEVKRRHPEAIFLAEAFTRPRVMHHLAKLGFSQSYTYFTWRTTKADLTQYFTELAQGPGREYFRPNVWPNTPDILHEYLQYGGRPAFVIRLILAATLSANYGIYGPAYELIENRAREFGSEEYLDSEKYQVRAWDLDRPDSLAPLITRLNRIRRENPALHSDWSLRFYPTDNDQILAYGKQGEDGADQIITVVSLDPHHKQSGWLTLPLAEFGLDERQTYQMHDLLTGARYLWSGARNFVAFDPQGAPGHVFRLRRRQRTERDFDYFF